MAKDEKDVVIDKGKWQISEMWKTEDWWAIWLGFIILIAGAVMYLGMGESYEYKDKKGNIKIATPKKDIPGLVAKKKAYDEKLKSKQIPYRPVKYYSIKSKIKGFQAKKSTLGKSWAKWSKKPHKWSGNPLDAFYMGKDRASAVKEEMKGKRKSLKAEIDKKESEMMVKVDAAKDKKEKIRIQEDFIKKNIAPILMDSKDMHLTKAVIKEAKKKAVKADTAAEAAGYKDESLNVTAELAIKNWQVKSPIKKGVKKKGVATTKHHSQWWRLLVLMGGMGIFFGFGKMVMGENIGKFLGGFIFVFILATAAFLISNQVNIKGSGIGYAAWAILLGLIISNTVGTPNWVKPAVQTEYYIKTGLVLLGAKILFGKLTTIGGPGIFVAWAVTPTVLLTTFWFGQKILKMESKELNITIAADMSVCGVSAAIATAAACRAKKEELTLAVGLSLVFTAVMMVVMPAIINGYFPSGQKGLYMAQILGGAWMGGTIDATGAVAAAGAFLGDTALFVAATIKMIQNILIGVIAFFVAIYWTTKVEAAKTGEKPGIMEVWYRFPKFVIGFIAASIFFSLVAGSVGTELAHTTVDKGVIKGMSDLFRGWFFCLAFVSIGLATNFRELAHQFKGGKPAILYVCGQSLNLILTLGMAYLMFYVVFPEYLGKIAGDPELTPELIKQLLAK